MPFFTGWILGSASNPEYSLATDKNALRDEGFQKMSLTKNMPL